MTDKMKATTILLLTALSSIMMLSCQPKDELAEKKKELKSLKKEVSEKREKILELEKEIAAADPEFAKVNRKEQLITAIPVKKDRFVHYVEVSGSVTSDRNVVISSENMGVIQSIRKKEGDLVRRGETVISQDTELLQKQLNQLETQYELASTMFEKQSNLWDKNIGTEVQYLEAKNNKENLETQIENVKTQIAKSKVRAPFSGSVEKIFVKEGEMAQPGAPLFRIVSLEDMFVEADLSERHIGSFKQGDMVTIHFPSIDETIDVKLTSVGKVIDEQNRTFSVEAKLPKVDFQVKPNLLAILKLKDYEKPDASIVPNKLIQKDNQGEFVYVIEENGEHHYAKKVHIERGITYKNETIVYNGLNGHELIVDQGFREVIDGSKVKIVDNKL
jgi:RND family efflux transporter MFP subunit